MRYLNRILSLACLIALAACGGGGGGSDGGGGTETPVLVPLSIPKNVTVTGTPDALTISWDPVEGAEGYNVYYSSDPAQQIPIYAAYPDSDLVQTTNTSAVFDFTGVQEPRYFRITAENAEEESASAYAAAILSIQVNATDPSLVDDYVSGLQWQRCNVGQTWDATTSACSGTSTVMTDTAAQGSYGTAPPASGWRPPTYTEVNAFRNCHMQSTINGQENPFLGDCHELVQDLLAEQDGEYPSFFVYDDDGLAPDGSVCTSHYFSGSVACSAPGIRDVRASLIRPIP